MNIEKIEKLKEGMNYCRNIEFPSLPCKDCPYNYLPSLEECTAALVNDAHDYINYLEKKNEHLEFFLDMQNKDNESMLGPMAWDEIVWQIHYATEVYHTFTIKELKERFPKLLGHIEEE